MLVAPVRGPSGVLSDQVAPRNHLSPAKAPFKHLFSEKAPFKDAFLDEALFKNLALRGFSLSAPPLDFQSLSRYRPATLPYTYVRAVTPARVCAP